MRLSQFDDIELWNLKDSGTSRLLYWLMRPVMGPLLRRSIRRRSRREQRDQKPAAAAEMIVEFERFALSKELLRAKRICIKARLREVSFVPQESLAVR